MNPFPHRLLAAALLVGTAALPPVALSQQAPPDAPKPGAAAVEPADAQKLMDKGVDFVKSKQNPDGGWQGPHDPPGVTALVLKAVADCPNLDPKTPWVQNGYKKLLSYQLENGGIYKDLLANYNTAIAISALAAAKNPEYNESVQKAVAYLKSLQWTDKIQGLPKGEAAIDEKNPNYGGFGYGRKGRADGSNTQMALDALHDSGLKADDPAYKAALKFIERMQNRSETNDQPWAGDDGGFVYTPAAGGESFAGEYKDANGRRMLRSYGSMTYAGLKSMIYCGLTKDDPRVKAAWDWLAKTWTLDENPGMRLGAPENAMNGMYYYYHTLARALHAYGQPILTDAQGNKHDWRLELINKLATLQKPDGSWVGEKKWMEDNPVLTTSYVLLALEEAQQDLKDHPANK